MQKARNIASLWCCFFASLSFAQDIGKLSGTVVSSDGEKLPHALVAIKELSKGVSANSEGYFAFDQIPFGTYLVTASFIGYQSISQTITLSANDKYNELKFILMEDTQTLAEVAVTGNASSEKERQGFALETISLKPFQNQSIELNKVLDQTAGLRVRQEGGLGSRVSYTMNGLRGKAVRFFLDGVPMDYYGSTFSANTIPVSMIERVEVYKGVVPAELGNDALGGAINLITKKQFSNAAELSYSYGSFNTHRATITANYREKKSGFSTKLSTFYNYSDNNYAIWGKDIYVTNLQTFEIERGLKVKRFHDKFESKAVKLDLGFTQKKWADQTFLGLLFSDMAKDLQHGTTMMVPFGEARYIQKVVMPYLVYQKHHFLLKALDMNVFASYSNLNRKLIDTSRNIYNWYGQIEGQRTLGGERSNSLNTLTEKVFLNRINLVYHFNENHQLGFNYVYSYLNRTNRDPILGHITEGYWAPQLLQKHGLGLVSQSQFFDKKLNVSLFGKYFGYDASIKQSEVVKGIVLYNDVKTSASALGYGLAGSYQATYFLTINASLEKANRLPESDEILGDGFSTISTTKLRPEQSDNANLGFKLHLFEKKSHKIRLTGNGFYRNVTDLIQQWQYDAGSFVYINFDKVQMKGVDTKLQYLYKTFFSLSQTVSYLIPIVKSDKDEMGNRNILAETRLPNTPFIQTYTDARITLPNLFMKDTELFFYYGIGFVDAFYRYSERIGKFNKSQIPAQLVHDCGIGYTFPKQRFSLAFDLHNLSDEQVFDNYAIQKPGRAAYVKTTFRFM